jgi:predicted transcriptional regulator
MTLTDSNTPRISDDRLVELTADLVSSFVARNSITPEAIPELIALIHKSLVSISNVGNEVVKPIPAVPVAQSVTDDAIICLEDGLRFKALKRHLKNSYNMTPDQYRAKWELPSHYPMVAPAYSKKRSALAVNFGFGKVSHKRRGAASTQPATT